MTKVTGETIKAGNMEFTALSSPELECYEVLTSTYPEDLVKEVNAYIEEGWEPKGGITISQFMYTSCNSPKREDTYAQAMIKYKEEVDSDA